MMTQYTDKKREQIQMFCMDDLVPQDHLLRLIDRKGLLGPLFLRFSFVFAAILPEN